MFSTPLVTRNRPLLSFAVAMRVLLTGKRQPRSAANLSGSQPQEVDDRHGIPEAIRYESSRRTSGSLSCEPPCPRWTATCHCEWMYIHSECFSQMNGGEMRIIIWTILALVLSSTVSVAQTTLNAGHYVLRNTPHDLFVNLGTEVILNVRFKPLETCPYTLDAVLRYDLPPNYNNTPINYTSATCNSIIDCGGEVFKCVNPTQPIPASFSQPVSAQFVNVRSGPVTGDFEFTFNFFPEPTCSTPVGQFVC